MVAMEAPSPPGTGGRLGQFPSTSVSFRCRRRGVNHGNLGDFRLSATYWGNVWSGPMGTETAVARAGGGTANLLGGARQHVPEWKVPFQQASRRNGRKSEVNHSRNNRSWPLFFWRNTISRMRLTDWQMSVCWKALGWESERHSFTP